MEWYQFLMLAVGLYAMHKDNTKMFNEFRAEIKDFHGRLCTLEEKYNQMMERYLQEKR